MLEPFDIDGSVVDKNESLAQRVRCAFRFRLGEYFLNTSEGFDYDLIFNHVITPAQVAQLLVGVIRDEGGDEIVDITDVEYSHNRETRRFKFACRVLTIHGTLSIDTEL
ncbi:MAG: hypothetical protein ISN29_02120 [Gammaproteobacteria bacterium AqS3]|nr:hypothetical protein [Gammaproteobacteria bacterium AqS3]